MSRNGSFRKMSGCLALWLLLAGCEQESADEYVSYQNLEQSAEAKEDLASAPDPKGTVVDPAPADPEDATSKVEPQPVTGDENTAVAAADGSVGETENPQQPPGGATDAAGTVTGATNESVAGGTADSASATVESTEPREIKLLVKNRQFQVEGPQGASRVSFDDIDLLKILNMEPVPVDAAEYLPDWLVALDGKRIRIRGFMYPTFEETGIKRFLLARDNQICCFGRDPKVYDLVRIRLRDGAETNYIEGRPFDVVGVFHIRPDVFDDQLDGLYAIEDAVVLDR